MRRRLAALVVVLLVAPGCRILERLDIAADGSAVWTWEITVEREEYETFGFFGSRDWSRVEASEITATENPRRFVADMFAVEDDDPIVDRFAANLAYDADDERATVQIGTDLELTELDGDARRELGAFALGHLAFEEQDGFHTLSAPALTDLEEFVGELVAVEGSPFTTEVRPGGDIPELEIEVEISVPGRVVSSDAHSRDGATLGWRWAVGEPGRPGIEVTWETDEGGFLGIDWGEPYWRWILVFLAIPVVGVLAALFGFGEAVRVWRRDRRDSDTALH